MSALPGQSFESYADTLECVALLEPEHISAYSLIIEEGTPFYDKYSGRAEVLPDEEEDRRMYHHSKEYLAEKGYHRYEVSNYARPGRECIHNGGYWTGVSYLGIGLGASSLMEGQRFSVIREMNDYLDLSREELAEGRQYENREILTEQDEMEEFMFLGLRLTEGIAAKDFKKRFGLNIEEIYGMTIGKLMEDGLMEMTGTKEDRRYRLSEFGLDVSNCVLAEFLL